MVAETLYGIRIPLYDGMRLGFVLTDENDHAVVGAQLPRPEQLSLGCEFVKMPKMAFPGRKKGLWGESFAGFCMHAKKGHRSSSRPAWATPPLCGAFGLEILHFQT